MINHLTPPTVAQVRRVLGPIKSLNVVDKMSLKWWIKCRGCGRSYSSGIVMITSTAEGDGATMIGLAGLGIGVGTL